MGEIANKNHEAFCHEYALTGNATKSYMNVYPKASEATAATQSSLLLRKPKINQRVDELKAATAKKLDLKSYDVALNFMRMGGYNLKDLYDENGEWKAVPDLPDDVAFAIVGIKKIETGTGAGKRVTYEYKFADKIAANANLGKHLGFYKEHQEAKNGIDISHLSPEKKKLVLEALLGGE